MSVIYGAGLTYMHPTHVGAISMRLQQPWVKPFRPVFHVLMFHVIIPNKASFNSICRPWRGPIDGNVSL